MLNSIKHFEVFVVFVSRLDSFRDIKWSKLAVTNSMVVRCCGYRYLLDNSWEETTSAYLELKDMFFEICIIWFIHYKTLYDKDEVRYKKRDIERERERERGTEEQKKNEIKRKHDWIMYAL